MTGVCIIGANSHQIDGLTEIEPPLPLKKAVMVEGAHDLRIEDKGERVHGAVFGVLDFIEGRSQHLERLAINTSILADAVVKFDHRTEN